MKWFSLSFALNYFSLTALMVLAGLSRNSALAADIGMVHSVTAVLFLGLSANARNVILGSGGKKSHLFLLMRAALVAPMLAASVYICGSFHDVGYLLAGMLVARRAAEWLVDISLSEKEVDRQASYARSYFLSQAALFCLVCLAFRISRGGVLAGVVALWSLSPLLWLSLRSRRFSLIIPDIKVLFPHVGSTMIVGIVLYMFRGLLILLVGKESAGDLFSAFAIGGIIPSFYGNVVGPGIESEMKLAPAGLGQAVKRHAVFCLSGAMAFVGAAMFAWTRSPLFIEILGQSGFFWGAVGLSLIGGAVMLLVQVERTALLQSRTGENAFAPDLLMNLAIIASVPYAYYLLGTRALAALYLWNSCMGWLFYKSYTSMLDRSSTSGGLMSVRYDLRTLARYLIAGLMILPVFFQLGHGLFMDHSLLYNSGGVLKNLPIPISAAACGVGILFLSGYRHTTRALYLIFALFCLMTISAAVSADGDMAAMKAKIFLMLQYLIPWSGLVLGCMFLERRSDLGVLQRAFLAVLILIVFPQLAVSYVDGASGDLRLRPYMYVFSIYQHLQYVPIVFCGAYLISLFGLYDRNKAAVLVLSPLMGTYALASTSRLAVIMIFAGVSVLLIMDARDRLRRINAALVFSAVFAASLVFDIPIFAGKYTTPLSESSSRITAWARAIVGPQRVRCLDYYADGIRHGTNRAVLFGQKDIPDRATFPSANNYYLDYLYNFGLIPFLPFLWFLFRSLSDVWRRRRQVLASPSALGSCFVVSFLLLDNLMNVGLRQPYFGIYTFFLWGVVLRQMSADPPAAPAGREIAPESL